MKSKQRQNSETMSSRYPKRSESGSSPVAITVADYEASEDNKLKPEGFLNCCMGGTRLLVLVILCLQNSMFTVLRRYSQGVLMETYSKVRKNVLNLAAFVQFLLIGKFLNSRHSMNFF